MNRLISSSLSLALFLSVGGCAKHSVNLLVRKTKSAASEAQWRTWANGVIARAQTNSTSLPRTEWPEFVLRVTDDGRQWQVLVSTNQSGSKEPIVILVALGGFESIGVIIGPPSYVEITPPQYPQISEPVYLGIYVRETH